MHASRDEIGLLTTTIVVAEDDRDLRSIYASALRRAGHVVWEAADGGEALKLVKTHSPELLLLDIWMPVMNGLEVLENLRGNTEAVGVRVVVLSQQDDSDTHLEGFALGIEDYWTKDLSLHELCERVEELARLAGTPPWPPE
jgi:DNA-binding response OmpR family regulator